MKKKKFAAIAAAACAAMMVFALAGCSSNDTAAEDTEGDDEQEITEETDLVPSGDELRFVTGGVSGTYYAYGSVLSQWSTNEWGVPVSALSSEGSKANVESIEDGDAELAFCQLDVATYAYTGTNLFDASVDNFSVVAALYPEQIQIVTCDPSIESVADLAGKTVSVGAANSGVYFNALDILGVYDISLDDINPVYQDFADSADSLQNGKIDAAFIVAGAPTTAITELSTSKQAYLVSMDDEHIAALMDVSPYYAEATISADTYGLDADVQTVAVLSVILAADTVSDGDVYNFTASLFDGAENNAEAHAKYAELSLETATSITSVPYAAGAAAYYSEQGIEVATK